MRNPQLDRITEIRNQTSLLGKIKCCSLALIQCPLVAAIASGIVWTLGTPVPITSITALCSTSILGGIATNIYTGYLISNNRERIREIYQEMAGGRPVVVGRPITTEELHNINRDNVFMGVRSYVIAQPQPSPTQPVVNNEALPLAQSV